MVDHFHFWGSGVFMISRMKEWKPSRFSSIVETTSKSCCLSHARDSLSWQRALRLDLVTTWRSCVCISTSISSLWDYTSRIRRPLSLTSCFSSWGWDSTTCSMHWVPVCKFWSNMCVFQSWVSITSCSWRACNST